MDTNIEEILNIENTKFYMVLAEPMLECLVTAIKHKQLSELSVVMWLKFKSEVHLRAPDSWTMVCSLKELANKFGKSKNTIIKCLKELEQGGFISKQSVRIDSHSNTPNQIAVRFPKEGLELANTYPSRRGTDSSVGLSSETNKLPTELVQNLNQEQFKKATVIKNTRKQKLEINKHTELSTMPATQKPKHVGCCMATPKEKIKPQTSFEDSLEKDPLLDEITILEKKMFELQRVEKELTARRQEDFRDFQALKSWRQVKSAINSLETQLEAIRVVKKKSSNDVHCLENTTSNSVKGGRRQHAIELPDKVSKKIERKIKELSTRKLITNPNEIEAQVKYQVANYEMGESLDHAANICFKLVKNNMFRTPGGFLEE